MKKLAALAALLPSAALAHPDHSHDALTLRHLLSEPDHVAMVVIGALVVATVVWWRIARNKDRDQ